jgi:hypothetical protein
MQMDIVLVVLNSSSIWTCYKSNINFIEKYFGVVTAHLKTNENMFPDFQFNLIAPL